MKIKSLFLATSMIGATILGGCFMTDGGKPSGDNQRPANLVISMGVKDVNNLSKPGLSKSAVANDGIVLSKLVVTLTSSVVTDAVIRDTVLADTGDFVSTSTDAQQVLRNYAVKPLRNWTIQVKTLDVNDSVIHISSSVQNNLTVGEVRPVTLNLASKFVVYVAKFVLPDSIGSQSSDQKQKLYVHRFMMVVDGDTVRDTSTTPPDYFSAAPDTHKVFWNYVKADTVHTLQLYVYADSLGDWDPNLPIFGDTIQITSTDTTYTPELPWMGPGSEHDPACQANPSNCGGATTGLTINIGAVGSVVIVPGVPENPLPKRKY